MAKFDYFYDRDKVTRKKFYENLRKQSFKKVKSYDVFGFGLDVCDFDKKKFDKYRRDLHGSNGRVPCTLLFCGCEDGKSHTFSINKRKNF